MEKLSHKLVEYGRQVREGILGGSWKCLGMSQSILRWDAWKSLGMLGSVLGGFGQIFIVKNYVFENKKVSEPILIQFCRSWSLLEPLGSLWERLGDPLWAAWEPLGSLLGSSWGVLGSSWGILGRSWGHFHRR